MLPGDLPHPDRTHKPEYEEDEGDEDRCGGGVSEDGGDRVGTGKCVDRTSGGGDDGTCGIRRQRGVEAGGEDRAGHGGAEGGAELTDSGLGCGTDTGLGGGDVGKHEGGELGGSDPETYTVDHQREGEPTGGALAVDDHDGGGDACDLEGETEDDRAGGAEGGGEGGQIVAQGTPEEVVAGGKGWTARYLARSLNGHDDGHDDGTMLQTTQIS